jgi:hypothetical protein
MDSGFVGLIIGGLTFVGGVISLIASRRNRKADIIDKLTAINSSLQNAHRGQRP